jgi:hypothetical protein
MTAQVLQSGAHLFRPNRAVRWREEPGRGGTSRRFVGENPPSGAVLYYALAAKAKSVGLRVVDYAGRTVRQLPAKAGPGLHRVIWDLTRPPTRPAPGESDDEPEGIPVPPGTYRVVLGVDGQELTQDLQVEADPSTSPPPPVSERARGRE